MTIPVHGLPPLLREGLEVALVPPALKVSRWQRVQQASTEGGQGQLVSFEGIQSISDAASLVGKSILARMDDLPADTWRHDADQLLGRAVYDDEHGDLGAITGLLGGGVQTVWCIDGPFGEVLLPAVDEFIVSMESEGAIHVRLPEGIVTQEDQ